VKLTRCKTCCMPTTRPDTAFVDGECSACISYRKRGEVDWNARHELLLQLLDRHHGEVIVPSSGGKDSTAQVMKMLSLGADVTAVTATTCDLSHIGRKNIDNLARYARTIEVTPNRTIRAKLNRLALELVGDISWPEHVSIHRVPFRVCMDTSKSLIMFGECPNEAYGGPLGTEATMQMTQRWVSEFGGFLGMRASDFIGMDGITERDMRDYLAPTDVELKEVGIEAHFLGQYQFWDSHENARIAMDAGMQGQLPCQANWWSRENVDNYQTGAHDFFGFLKYGYGRLCAQISVDIRAGLIGRHEAMAMVQLRDGLFPSTYLDSAIHAILARIDMTLDQFLAIANQFLNRDLFVEDRVEWGTHLTLKEFA